MSVCYEDPDANHCENPDMGQADDGWKCVLKVETKRIIDNLAAIRCYTSSRIIAVVKNNGYGLGLIPYCRLLNKQQVDCFAVAQIEEAIEMRRAHIWGMILVMTPPQDVRQAASMVEWDLTATVGSFVQAMRMQGAALKAKKVCPVHVKFDTGLGRFGFDVSQAQELAHRFPQYSHLKMEGVYSHCGAVKAAQITAQFEAFQKVLSELKKAGYEPTYQHFCNSSLTLNYPSMQLNAVRLGSALVGRVGGRKSIKLQPVVQLRARVMEVHLMQVGSRPGYGGVEKLRKMTSVAVVNAGWQDGLMIKRQYEIYSLHDLLSQIKQIFVSLGKRRYASYQGRMLPVIGRGGMNFTLLNANGSDIAPGDWVTMDVNPLWVRREIPREYTL
jgi:alanine racemase